LNNLDLFGTQLTNLEGISAFKKLTYLEVTSNSIDDLSAVDGNTTIEMLKLSNNPVKDLSALDHMPVLKTVILSRGQETNFTRPVSELPFTVEYSIYFEVLLTHKTMQRGLPRYARVFR
jgi:Leucine-rich repeat (LRR) protein